MAELTLTESQNGQRFRVKVGDLIVVDLPESSGAGYRWSSVALDERHLLVEAHGYVTRGPATGSAGTSAWRVRARHAGVVKLELIKSRSWEPDTPAAARFVVTLDIVDS